MKRRILIFLSFIGLSVQGSLALANLPQTIEKKECWLGRAVQLNDAFAFLIGEMPDASLASLMRVCGVALEPTTAVISDLRRVGLGNLAAEAAKTAPRGHSNGASSRGVTALPESNSQVVIKTVIFGPQADGLPVSHEGSGKILLMCICIP